MNRKMVGIGAAIALAITATAAIASYTTREALQAQAESDGAAKHAKAAHHPRQEQKMASAQPQQPVRQRCDDNNIIGTAAGGIGGGVVGSQFGSGSGKTAATIAGVLGGAYLGNQYIPTRNATCQQH
jgi:uncharacterized protein YcfJ